MSENALLSPHGLPVLNEFSGPHWVKKTYWQRFYDIFQTIESTRNQSPNQPGFVTLVTFNGLTTRTPAASQLPTGQLSLFPDESGQPAGPFHEPYHHPQPLRPEFQTELDVEPTFSLSILTDLPETNASPAPSLLQEIVEQLHRRGWNLARPNPQAPEAVLSFTDSDSGDSLPSPTLFETETHRPQPPRWLTQPGTTGNSLQAGIN
jgi:hypothetical protein